MDLTDDLDQNDSGMESLTASKGDTPERKPMELEAFTFPEMTNNEMVTTNEMMSIKEYDDVSIKSQFSPLSPVTEYDYYYKSYEEEPDESLYERLWGLSEMFPDFVRNGMYTATTTTVSGVKSLYGLSRSVMWVIASSSVILFAPVIFEVERAQMCEMEKSQQKQVLLGTNTALSGPMPNMPPMPR